MPTAGQRYEQARAQRVLEGSNWAELKMRRDAMIEAQERQQRAEAWGKLQYLDEMADDEGFTFNAPPEAKQQLYDARNGLAQIVGLPPREDWMTAQEVFGKHIRDVTLAISKREIPAAAAPAYLDSLVGPRWRDQWHDMRLRFEAAEAAGIPEEGEEGKPAAPKPAEGATEGGQTDTSQTFPAGMSIDDQLIHQMTQFEPQPEGLKPEEARLRYNLRLEALRNVWANPEASDDVKTQMLIDTSAWAKQNGLASSIEEVAAAAQEQTQWEGFLAMLPEEARLKKDGTPKTDWQDFEDPFNQAVAKYVQLFGLTPKDAINQAQEDLKREKGEGDEKDRELRERSLAVREREIALRERTAGRGGGATRSTTSTLKPPAKTRYTSIQQDRDMKAVDDYFVGSLWRKANAERIGSTPEREITRSQQAWDRLDTNGIKPGWPRPKGLRRPTTPDRRRRGKPKITGEQYDALRDKGHTDAEIRATYDVEQTGVKVSSKG